MKVAYVTGATGCLGRNLVDELIKDHWDIVVLHRRSSDLSRLKGCDVRYQEVDLHDLESVRKSLPFHVDTLFHVAANTSHWSAEARQQWKDNVLATRHLVRAALEKHVQRFIFTSTGATNPFQWTDEQHAMKIENPYIRTKRLAELEVYAGVEQGLDAVILQPIIVVGAYDYNSYAQIFTELKHGTYKLAFPGKIAFCHAGDVARAHIQAYEKGRTGEHYVLGGPYVTWLEAIQLIAKAVGTTSRIRTAPPWLLHLVSRYFAFVSFFTGKKPLLTPELVRLVTERCADVSYYDKRKAKLHLGYESRPLAMMIQDCYEWLVREGRI